MMKMFPVIDLVATGENITRLRGEKNLSQEKLAVELGGVPAGHFQMGDGCLGAGA